MKFFPSVLAIITSCTLLLPAQAESAPSQWTLDGDSISLAPEPGRKDHFAMSGRSVDLILEWSVGEDGSFDSVQWIRWPMLRTIPNNTHASFNMRFKEAPEARPLIDGKTLSPGKVSQTRIDGIFSVTSSHPEGIASTRTILPASSAPAVIEIIELRNTANRNILLSIPAWRKSQDSQPGTRGIYKVEESLLGEGEFTLAPGGKRIYTLVRAARLAEEAPYCDNPESELAARRAFLDEMRKSLVLKTPEPILDGMFQFAKIRATESIFSTRGGLMHGPGGYNKFLAAIWTNDQAEYVNPFFPFLGNMLGNESAMTCYRMFAQYMNPEFKSIPSSIIAEGDGTWNGAGDRGDQAMLAYGASRFALASGNKGWGKELLPLIDWSLEYCRRHKTPEGVVTSDSDELEGRFPSGKANLCTNILYYDALITAANLWKAIAPSSPKPEEYNREAAELKQAIKKYFEGTVEGFATYKYYETNDVLRSWICMPLVIGMDDRAEATVDALFSPRLWFGNGMLTASGTTTYWDRSALYAFRGIFAVGLQDRALPKLLDYSRERLLGKHVPYAIEAWPEANQSHLSAESGLYCRIFTEGLFGITPTGFRSFSSLPRLPKTWNKAALSNIKAFGSSFNIALERTEDGIRVLVSDMNGTSLYDQTRKEGIPHSITLP